MNIIQRMAKATAELGTVAKNLKIDAGRNSYKAVSERDVIDAVKPIEAKFGIYSYPVEREIVESDQLESEGYDGKKKTTFFFRTKVVYRFVNVDEPNDFIEVTSYGDGMDSGDKSPGKSMTYADKLALLKAYKISTGEDPDQEASKEASYTRKTAPKRDDKAKEAQLNIRDRLMAENRKFCADNGIPEEWISKKYGYLAFDGMTDALLADVKAKADKIIEAYKEENK